MSVFEKTAEVIKKVVEETGLSENDIRMVVSRVVPGFHNPSREKKVELTKTDVMVYETLLNNGFNPNTVYRWFLVTSAPKDVQRKIRSGEITIRQALNMRNKLRQQYGTDDDAFIDEVIWYVEEYIL
ncbi:hypothetical protein GOV05_00285 [Candidatus Woesearchaeota archaeon]|nr:hypothetical protein [Candidatus Woesearchaeota archaeon]